MTAGIVVEPACRLPVEPPAGRRSASRSMRSRGRSVGGDVEHHRARGRVASRCRPTPTSVLPVASDSAAGRAPDRGPAPSCITSPAARLDGSRLPRRCRRERRTRRIAHRVAAASPEERRPSARANHSRTVSSIGVEEGRGRPGPPPPRMERRQLSAARISVRARSERRAIRRRRAPAPPPRPPRRALRYPSSRRVGRARGAALRSRSCISTRVAAASPV